MVYRLAVCLAAAAAEMPVYAELGSASTMQSKASYAAGYKVAQRLWSKDRIDEQAFLQGFRDALERRESRMSASDIASAISWYKSAHASEEQKHTQSLAKTRSQAFLEQNKRRKDVVVLPSGVQYEVLASGHGRAPKASDTVAIHYKASLVDGTVYADTTSNSSPKSLPLDKLVPGLNEALRLMTEGGRWKVVVPPELAYGTDGSLDGKVGPNEALILDMRLVSVLTPEQAQAVRDAKMAAMKSRAMQHHSIR